MANHPEPRRPPRVRWVARPGGGRRGIVELDPGDERAYRNAVAPLVPRIERALGPGVAANRAAGRDSLAVVRLEPWRVARGRWRRDTARIRLPLRVRADVADFYGSVTERALRRSLGPDADEPIRVLRTLWGRGVVGLPVGPDPSAILANAVLGPVDEALERSGLAVHRWVDDWTIGLPSRAEAGRLLLVLELALRDLGLELRHDKTRLVGDDDDEPEPPPSAVRRATRAMMPAP